MSAELNEYVHGPASEPGDVATGLAAHAPDSVTLASGTVLEHRYQETA